MSETESILQKNIEDTIAKINVILFNTYSITPDDDDYKSHKTIEDIKKYMEKYADKIYMINDGIKKNFNKLEELFKILENIDKIKLKQNDIDIQEALILSLGDEIKEINTKFDKSEHTHDIICCYLTIQDTTLLPISIPINNSIKYSDIVNIDKHLGIVNLGATCFLNTALQFLYSIEFLRNYYLIINPNRLDKLGCAIKTLFYIMYTNENRNSINLETIFLNYNEKSENLYSILSNIDPRFNNKNKQEDCSEYLKHLINNLFDQNSINNLDKLFNIYILDIKNCSKGRVEKSIRFGNTIDNSIYKFIDLQIYTECDNIQKLINKYFSINDNIEKTINKCKDLLGGDSIPINEQKVPYFNECNRYLIISLNRFNFGDLSSQKIRQNIIANPKIYILNREYILTSCAIHIGNTTRVGHYVLHKFNNEGIFNNEINDSNINRSSPQNINTDGYIFLYRLTNINDKQYAEYNIKQIKELINRGFEDLINLNIMDGDTPFNIEQFNCNYINDTELSRQPIKKKELELQVIRSKCMNKYLLMNKNDIDFNKYIKYKNKYLQLKSI
jgi:hypothetical protein